jgi:hypothetical protein
MQELLHPLKNDTFVLPYWHGQQFSNRLLKMCRGDIDMLLDLPYGSLILL